MRPNLRASLVLLTLAVASAAGAAPAPAAAPSTEFSAAELADFAERELKYASADSQVTTDVLARDLQSGTRFADAAAKLAATKGVPAEVAPLYAALVVVDSRLNHGLDSEAEDRAWRQRRRDLGAALLERAPRSLAVFDAVAMHIGWIEERCDTAGLSRVIGGFSAAEARRMADEHYCPGLFGAWLEANPKDAVAAVHAWRLMDWHPVDEVALSGVFWARAQAATGPHADDQRAAALAAHVEMLLFAGLIDEALAAIDRAPAAVRDRALSGEALDTGFEVLDGELRPDPRANLALARWLKGDVAAAERLHRALTPKVDPIASVAMLHALPQDARGSMVRAVVLAPPEAKVGYAVLRQDFGDGNDDDVRLSGVSLPEDLEGLAFARYLERAGMTEDAAEVLSHAYPAGGPAYHGRNGDGLARIFAAVGPDFDRERARWAEAYAAAQRRRATEVARLVGAPAAMGAPREPTGRPRFAEHKVPTEFLRPKPAPGADVEDDDANAESSVAEDDAEDQSSPVDVPVLRRAQRGDLVVLVTASQDFDPVGEVSPGGYWVHVSQDGGRTWRERLYTGLQVMRPYTVVLDSRLPLLRGDTLELEVEVNEIDDRTVTFPPIGVGIKRHEDGLFLEIPLAALRADRDHDGLTDIAEDRLGLDPDSPDSDGDRLVDGSDPLPNVAHATASERARIMAAVLAAIAGFDENAIVTAPAGSRSGAKSGDAFDLMIAQTIAGKDLRKLDSEHTMMVGGSPADFAGLMPDRRVMVYGRDQVEVLERAYGDFYPLSIGPVILSPDRKEAVVEWSAGWTGGGLRLVRDRKGRWTVKDRLSEWIT